MSNIYNPPHPKSIRAQENVALCRFTLYRIRPFFGLLCFFALLYSTLTCAADNPFSREIRLDAWGVPLTEAMNQVMEQSSVDITTAPSMGSMAQLKTYRVYIYADHIPAYQAIEWISKSIGCRYIRDGAHSVMLTCGLEIAMQEQQKVIFENVETLLGDQKDKTAFTNVLQELTKPLALLPQRNYLRVEEQDPEIKLVAALPQTMALNVRKILQIMGEKGIAVVPESIPVAPKDEIDLFSKLNTTVIVRYNNRPLREVVQDLTLQSGLMIAIDCTPFQTSEPSPITLDTGEMVFRDAIESLGKQLNLQGVQFMLPHSVWLTADTQRWAASYSRRNLWDALTVQGYNISSFASAAGGGESIAHRIRTTICTETWEDPVTGVCFFPPTGCLIVVAPVEVQRDVLSALCQIKEQVATVENVP